MKKLIKSSRIYSHRGLVDGAIVVDGERVLKIMAKDAIPADFDGEVVDYGDSRIIPGIIDTHNHGCFGFDMLAKTISADDIDGYLEGLASQGVTAAFPSVGGSVDGIRALAEHPGTVPGGARIMGIHSEGPWAPAAAKRASTPAIPPWTWPMPKRWSKRAAAS